MDAPASLPNEDVLRRTWETPGGLRGFFTAVNHRNIGMRFLITGLIFLLLGGTQALLMRTQLAQPDLDIVSAEFYRQLFSMHGTTMMFLFAVPIFEGLAIYLVPLMIGARDMAFPRLNAFGYWVYLLSGLSLYVGFFLGYGADSGWFAHTPLSSDLEFTPDLGMDFWVTSVTFLEISALVAAVELIVTIFKLRAPGMSLSRMPLFVWSILIMSFMILFAMPAVLLATITIGLDRLVGTHFFNAAMGGDPILYQHIFWFFGHPEVYIIFTPALGVVASVLATFVRRGVAAYNLVALSFVAMGVISFGVWAHHFLASGIPPLGLSFFAAASMMVAIPSGIQIFAFIATAWQGRPRFDTPFLFLLGFVIIFVVGGMTGVMLGSVPVNWQAHDSYFVVAHLHYVLIGGAVFPLFAGFYYWFPKFTGRMLSERLGKWQFWLMFLGFNATFFIQHVLGLGGMSRRVHTYQADLGWGTMNLVSTLGSYVLALGFLVFVWNVIASLRGGAEAGPDPWRAGTLEWATDSVPKPYNFLVPPVVRSRYPLWEERDRFGHLRGPEGLPESQRPGEDGWSGSPGEPDEESGDRWQGRLETAADRGERGLPQFDERRRESFGTSLMDAEPESRIDQMAPSIWPLFLALSVGVAFIGAMASLWFVPIGAVLAYVSLIGWHWPFGKELAT